VIEGLLTSALLNLCLLPPVYALLGQGRAMVRQGRRRLQNEALSGFPPLGPVLILCHAMARNQMTVGCDRVWMTWHELKRLD
jgi:hypothetical protein